jgi:hypothetical protein
VLADVVDPDHVGVGDPGERARGEVSDLDDEHHVAGLRRASPAALT